MGRFWWIWKNADPWIYFQPEAQNLSKRGYVTIPEEQPVDIEKKSLRKMNFEQVKILQRAGSGIREISRMTGLHRQTVKKYLAMETIPARAIALTEMPQYTPFLNYLADRWSQGERNIRQLSQEIEAMGYQGSYSAVVRAKAFFANPASPAKPQYRSLSARQSSILLCLNPQKRNYAETRFCEVLCDTCSDVKIAHPLAQAFVDIVKNQEAESLDAWLETAINSEIKEMKSFAQGIKGDYDAVRAALSLPWSNGRVEGQVNRLKNIKRQMYGRAGFELLRRRVLYRGRAG